MRAMTAPIEGARFVTASALLDPLRIHAAAEPRRVVVVGEVVRGRPVRAAVAVLRRVHVVAAAEGAVGVVDPLVQVAHHVVDPVLVGALGRAPVGSSVFGSWLMSGWFIPSRQSRPRAMPRSGPPRRRGEAANVVVARAGAALVPVRELEVRGPAAGALHSSAAQSRLPEALHVAAACLPLMYACGRTPGRETARTWCSCPSMGRKGRPRPAPGCRRRRRRRAPRARPPTDRRRRGRRRAPSRPGSARWR